MARRLLALASLLSLLRYFAITALWVRSYWAGDALVKSAYGQCTHHCTQISSQRGRLLGYEQIDPPFFASDLMEPAGWRYSRSSNPVRPDIGSDHWLSRIGISID